MNVRPDVPAYQALPPPAPLSSLSPAMRGALAALLVHGAPGFVRVRRGFVGSDCHIGDATAQALIRRRLARIAGGRGRMVLRLTDDGEWFARAHLRAEQGRGAEGCGP